MVWILFEGEEYLGAFASLESLLRHFTKEYSVSFEFTNYGEGFHFEYKIADITRSFVAQQVIPR